MGLVIRIQINRKFKLVGQDALSWAFSAQYLKQDSA